MGVDSFGVSPDPYLRAVRNATIGIPVSGLGRLTFTLGAWDENKAFIDEIKLGRNRLKAEVSDFQPPTETVEGPCIFGGLLMYAYGHFLTESLARVWALRDTDRDIVWVLPGGRSESKLNRFHMELCSLLGLDVSRMRFVKSPTKFTNIVFPSAGFVLGLFCHEAYISAIAVYPATQIDLNKKVWLSRSALSELRTQVINERELEAALSADGWTILHPEKHAIREQLRVMADAAVIAGFDGSAFHTLLLLEKVNAKVVIVPRGTSPRIGPTFDIIAQVKGLEQYVVPAEMIGIDVRHRGNSKFKLVSPIRLYEAIEGVVKS